jgi:hypothetical protein
MMDEQWTLQHDGVDLVIYGPGKLEIVLSDFDPQRTSRSETLPESLLGALLQRACRYPLEAGYELELISTSNPSTPDTPELHRLHVGTKMTWELPEEFAEQLHDWFARVTREDPGGDE